MKNISMEMIGEGDLRVKSESVAASITFELMHLSRVQQRSSCHLLQFYGFKNVST